MLLEPVFPYQTRITRTSCQSIQTNVCIISFFVRLSLWQVCHVPTFKFLPCCPMKHNLIPSSACVHHFFLEHARELCVIVLIERKRCSCAVCTFYLKKDAINFLFLFSHQNGKWPLKHIYLHFFTRSTEVNTQNLHNLHNVTRHKKLLRYWHLHLKL
jgi:hypothetical protein